MGLLGTHGRGWNHVTSCRLVIPHSRRVLFVKEKMKVQMSHHSADAGMYVTLPKRHDCCLKRGGFLWGSAGVYYFLLLFPLPLGSLPIIFFLLFTIFVISF